MSSEVAISVVIPTYRRPKALARCLKALARQRYPRDGVEVIVVDDGSESGLEPVVRSRRDELSVRLLSQENRGPAVARNRGARAARGRFLAFTDDDCEPVPGWLGAVVGRLERTPDAMVGGPVRNALPDNPYSTASQSLISHLYRWYNREPTAATFFCSNNLALAAERFHELGGFRSMGVRAAGEDRDLCDRWLERGHRMVWEPDAVVHHAHPLSLRGFWKQHFAYGRGAFRFHEGRRRRSRSFSVEPLPFYTGLIARGWRTARGPAAWAQGSLLALTQMANAAGFFAEACVAGLERAFPRPPRRRKSAP